MQRFLNVSTVVNTYITTYSVANIFISRISNDFSQFLVTINEKSVILLKLHFT